MNNRHHSDPGLDSDFDLLRTAVREAGALALGYFGKPVDTRRKADGTRVSEADLAADRLLHTALAGARPDYGWLSEESPDTSARLAAGRVWIVDPIDGTTAFLRGKPDWTVSAGLVEQGTPQLGVVFNPVTDQCFTAQRRAGAHVNGRRLAIADRDRLEGSTIIAPQGSLRQSDGGEPWPPVTLIWANSIAYRMALVASGAADATLSLTGKSEWDLAAATLLVQEAGGVVTTPDDRPLVFNQPTPRLAGLVAAGPRLHRLLVARTRRLTDHHPRQPTDR